MALKQLSDGGPDGTVLGQSADDKIAMHGVTPVAQADAIADISVTGTYATDDTPIETAVNGIFAALRAKGIIASS